VKAGVHNSIESIDAGQWNALGHAGIPFLRHEFFAALEHTRCVGPRTGWEPRYITLSDPRGLAAAAPAFVKSHSYGEFVFDFDWARAYARIGERYYPKLTIAVPFTPATGPRLLVRPDLDQATVAGQLIEAIQNYAMDNAFSSVHSLFLDEAGRQASERAGWLLRRDCQFHWSNRGYQSFEQYLETFTAEKRKKVKRERRRVAEAGISFDTLSGNEIDERLLSRVYAFHRNTFLRHGREPYLTRAFFTEICRTLGDALVIKVARVAGEPIATSICFRSGDTLYGRYWGCASQDYHSLHFEACYYQGIEFCIEHGLSRFEPGAQGEYKVSRGFEPAYTWSAHYIADPRFRRAIGDYLVQEGSAVDAYAAEVQEHVPYRERRGIIPGDP
jgi:predicted N-acyltransferase